MPNKKQKNENYLVKAYRESWQYVKDSRKFVYIAIAIFLFFFLIGFFLPIPADIETKLLQFIQDLIAKTQGMSQTQLIRYIFFNNVQTSFLSIFLGLVLGIFPVITSISNGYLLGFVSARVVQEEGAFVLWRLLPHGIFELPALFISLGIGLKLGTAIFDRKMKKTFKDHLIKSAKVFILIVIPLLFIAAIIEGTLISLLG